MQALAAASFVVFLFCIACDPDGGSECESARTSVVETMDSLCSKDVAYRMTAFCKQCVMRGYYATSGASDCLCTRLTFDQDFCAYRTGSEAVAQVRGALDYANEQCPSFTLELDDAGAMELSE